MKTLLIVIGIILSLMFFIVPLFTLMLSFFNRRHQSRTS